MTVPDTADPRVERSRAQLTEALGSLLHGCDGKAITVSALCAEAGVSRPTFYQHFTTIDDVAVAGIEQRFAQLKAEIPDGPDAPLRLMTAFLRDLEAECSTWRRTIGNGTAFSGSRDAVETWFADRLAEKAPEAGPTAVRYAAAGFLAVVRAWLLQEPGPERLGVEALAAQLVALATGVLEGTRSTLGP